MIRGTHSPFVNMAAGMCDGDNANSCVLRSFDNELPPGRTLDMNAWERYLINAHDATYGHVISDGEFLNWLGDQDFDLSAMMQLLPIIESQLLIEDGKVTGFAEKHTVPVRITH